jgi:hypothetical protein
VDPLTGKDIMEENIDPEEWYMIDNMLYIGNAAILVWMCGIFFGIVMNLKEMVSYPIRMKLETAGLPCDPRYARSF